MAPGNRLWKEKIGEWLENERRDLEINPVKLFPYLSFDNRLMMHAIIRPGTPLNQPATIKLPVVNLGISPSWTCHIKVYEGPFTGASQPFSTLELRGQTITTVQGGEFKTVELPWEHRLVPGRLVALCFDPLFDPPDVDLVDPYARFNRHLLHMVWTT